MNKNKQQVLELLKTIRAKEYNKLEPCVIKEIDELIFLLENSIEEKRYRKMILSVIGKILDKIPQIIMLIEKLTR